MSSRLIRFFLIIAVLFTYTSYKACQLWPSQPVLMITLTIPLFALMLAGIFVHRSQPTVFDALWFRCLTWAGTFTMGLWGTFILLSLPVDLLHLCISIFNYLDGASAPTLEKIARCFQALSLVLLGLSGGFAILGFIEVLRGPRIKEISIPIQNLDPALIDLKIAQISDLHIGATIRKEYVEEVVRRTNATNPDLIVITGDLADGEVATISKHLAALANLQARFGIFYVTGNHEYYWGAEQLLEKLEAFGFIALLNENRVVQIGKAKLLIAGITDPAGAYFLAGHTPDIKKARGIEENAQAKILLSHRPDPFFEADLLGFDLQLSGHTHGGQFFPFNLLVALAHKYYHGLNQHGRLWLYVNPGTGYWGPANRFGISSEITLIKLVSELKS